MSRPRRRLVRTILLLVVPVAAILVALHYYVAAQRYVVTENAYVKANQIGISAEIDGRVRRVSATDNRMVRAGELLFELDPEPFRIALAKAEAEVSMVRLRMKALRAEYGQVTEELREARQNVKFYDREFGRQQTLSRKGIASVAKRDAAEQNLSNARQRVSTVREKRRQILARLGGSLDVEVEHHPEYLEAKANRDQAALDLRRTRILAPVDGMVGQVKLEPGEYVKAGQTVLPLIQAREVWIEANLKETQLTHVREGLTAKIVIDAYPEHPFEAQVTSISPSTGAELSILPPQNASGNWVKVVQRVPVRLELRNAATVRLRAGMTARVSIDTERVYDLVDIVGSALAWRPER